MDEELLQLQLDPTERAFFIERTGVIMRWILIGTCSLIQLVSPLIPDLVFYIAVPVAVFYNGLLNFLIYRQRPRIIVISHFSTVIDILVSVTLIYYSGAKDVYLWYFVLLVSHAARFGIIGSFISPLLFSIVYIAGLALQGIVLPTATLVIRSTFFIITGVVSGYLAREEQRRFQNILRQQQEILTTQQKRRQLRDTLNRYVSYNVVEELIEHPEELRVGGCQRKVTVLFADIQGFTELLASQEPEAIVTQLNQYLTEMSQLIFTYDGMVDKFVGDAIIGIFGALGERPDDALRAVNCALAMQQRLAGLQQQWRQESAAVFHSRIAVSTGMAILGNIGSPQRMDFTAIGDPVNIASRLQAAAEIDSVIITSATYNEVKTRFRFKDRGGMLLKGKAEPIAVYEVRGSK